MLSVRNNLPQAARHMGSNFLDTPAHHSNLIQLELLKHGIVFLPHQSYFPDITSCDFLLFALLKTLHGYHINNSEHMKAAQERLFT
jgi:hypothetical protein